MTDPTDDDTMREMGAVLGQHFTEGQLNELGDLIEFGAEACEQAAIRILPPYDNPDDMLAPEDLEDMAAGYRQQGEALTKLVGAIRAGEELGREDHDV